MGQTRYPQNDFLDDSDSATANRIKWKQVYANWYSPKILPHEKCYMEDHKTIC